MPEGPEIRGAADQIADAVRHLPALSLQHVDVGEVRLHVASAGQGRPVVLLHGFPCCYTTWRSQVEPLVRAGYHVLMPDMRGFHLSDKPPSIQSYSGTHLARDVVGLIRAFGYERACVVGHDWGAAVAWTTVILYPDAVERLVSINITHPRLLRRALTSPRGALRWWYMFFFQLPWLPEMVLRSRHGMTKCLRSVAARPDVFSDSDVDEHLRAIRVPGAATAALNYYRALFRGNPSATGPVRVPTMLLWGERDHLIGNDLLEGLDRVCPDLELVRLPNAAHYAHVEESDQVNAHLVRFLNVTESTPAR